MLPVRAKRAPPEADVVEEGRYRMIPVRAKRTPPEADVSEEGRYRMKADRAKRDPPGGRRYLRTRSQHATRPRGARPPRRQKVAIAYITTQKPSTIPQARRQRPVEPVRR